MSSEAENKSIRMLPRTLDAVEKIRDAIRSPSFSDTVKSAIDILDLLVDAVQKGDRILLEDKSGRQVQITLRGVKHG